MYSLGVVLYEMLTGMPPFRGDTAVAIAYQHLEDQPPPLRTLRPGIPQALEAVVLRCLAKERWSRYQSAAVLAADVGRFAARPVADGGRQARREPAPRNDTHELAAGPSPGRTARSSSRRGHRVRTLALAVTAATVATLAGGAYLLARGGPPGAARVPPPLFAPVALRSTAQCDGFLKARLSLSWTPSLSTFADGYVLYRATSPAGPFEKVALLPGRTTRTYVDHRLDTGRNYYYEVRATSGSRVSLSFVSTRSKTPSLCLF